MTAVCLEFSRQPGNIGRTVDNYLETVSDRGQGFFSKTCFKTAHGRALNAISGLVKSKAFLHLSSSTKDAVVQELLKYSIQYLGGAAVRVVKLESLENAAAFDNRIMNLLTRLDRKSNV